MTYIDQYGTRLSSLRAEEFNKWRQENDFPRILEFFKSSLSKFPVWMASFGLTDEEILRVGIAHFLLPEDTLLFGAASDPGTKYLITTENRDKGTVQFVAPRGLDIGSPLSPTGSTEVKECRRFTPYLAWAREQEIRIHPSSGNGRIAATRFEAPDDPHYSKVFLLGELELFSVRGAIYNGKVSMPFVDDMAGRNLDFLDLDFLSFSGPLGSSSTKRIAFSSARHWSIEAAELSFFYFADSNLDAITVRDSELTDWRFFGCVGIDGRITNTILTRCQFGYGGFSPYLDNVDLRDLDFTPFLRQEE